MCRDKNRKARSVINAASPLFLLYPLFSPPRFSVVSLGRQFSALRKTVVREVKGGDNDNPARACVGRGKKEIEKDRQRKGTSELLSRAKLNGPPRYYCRFADPSDPTKASGIRRDFFSLQQRGAHFNCIKR